MTTKKRAVRVTRRRAVLKISREPFPTGITMGVAGHAIGLLFRSQGIVIEKTKSWSIKDVDQDLKPFFQAFLKEVARKEK